MWGFGAELNVVIEQKHALEGGLFPDANRGDLTVLYFGLAAVRQHCGHFYFCSAN